MTAPTVGTAVDAILAIPDVDGARQRAAARAAEDRRAQLATYALVYRERHGYELDAHLLALTDPILARLEELAR